MSSRAKGWGGTGLGVGLLVATATCQAQTAASQDVLGEIVVTAEKRESTVQETPISITAFSGDAPGYGTETTTTGTATSGNSSVCNWKSDTRPKTTSASMLTIVMTGRLIAKSEIVMLSLAA